MCGPEGVLRISCTALTAFSTVGNCAIATFVGITGASRSVAKNLNFRSHSRRIWFRSGFTFGNDA